MEPEGFRFGGGASSSVIHPIVAVAMIVTIVLMFLLPRKYGAVPFLLTTFLVPFGQVVVLGGVHFLVYRIIVIFGIVLLVGSKSSSKTATVAGGFNHIDLAFVCFVVSNVVVFVLQWMQMQALINQLGGLLDVLGGYFVLRYLIQNEDDIRRVIKLFAVIATIMAVCMLYEQVTVQNVFGFLGGMFGPPEVRDGRVRSHGVFQHAILAGTFGATLLPLFVGLWKSGESKILPIIAIISSTIITVTSNASTPLLAYMAGIAGICFWPLRHKMRAFRWGLAITLVSLHILMKAPVWALIARVDLTGSSSGYQRYMLVDNFIRHFSSWWLLGTKDFNTWGWDMFDLSNQYVAYGLTGGLAAFAFFIAVISRCFGSLGKRRECVAGDRKREWFVWSVGAALFANVVAFFGIGYFDQTQVAWYALLASISVMVSETAPPALLQFDSAGTAFSTKPSFATPRR